MKWELVESLLCDIISEADWYNQTEIDIQSQVQKTRRGLISDTKLGHNLVWTLFFPPYVSSKLHGKLMKNEHRTVLSEIYSDSRLRNVLIEKYINIRKLLCLLHWKQTFSFIGSITCCCFQSYQLTAWGTCSYCPRLSVWISDTKKQRCSQSPVWGVAASVHITARVLELSGKVAPRTPATVRQSVGAIRALTYRKEQRVLLFNSLFRLKLLIVDGIISPHFSDHVFVSLPSCSQTEALPKAALFRIYMQMRSNATSSQTAEAHNNVHLYYFTNNRVSRALIYVSPSFPRLDGDPGPDSSSLISSQLNTFVKRGFSLFLQIYGSETRLARFICFHGWENFSACARWSRANV